MDWFQLLLVVPLIQEEQWIQVSYIDPIAEYSEHLGMATSSGIFIVLHLVITQLLLAEQESGMDWLQLWLAVLLIQVEQ